MIPTVQGHPLFTQALLTKFDELLGIEPTGFLRSFFRKKTTTAKTISVVVRRGTEKVAVDILRGTEGNRNEMKQHSMKIFQPPYFREYFDATDIDHYDIVFGAITTANNGVITQAVQSAINNIKVLKYKIERALELQCAQVFNSGIVQLNTGDNIDYKRQAASKPTTPSGELWTVDTVEPGIILQDAATFIRTEGRTHSPIFNVIMGINAHNAFMNNPKVFEKGDLRRIDLVSIGMPQDMGEGAVFHGEYAYGSHKYLIWTYPQYYDNSEGVKTPYVPDDNIFVIPTQGTEFDLSFAGVPYLVNTGNVTMPQIINMKEGDYHIFSTIDDRAVKHEFGVSSAGLAVPVSVDMIYSTNVAGSGGGAG